MQYRVRVGSRGARVWVTSDGVCVICNSLLLLLARSPCCDMTCQLRLSYHPPPSGRKVALSNAALRTDGRRRCQRQLPR